MDKHTVDTFERILDLEFDLRMAKASISCRPMGISDWQATGQRDALIAARARYDAALDALSLDELRAFGPYRKAAREAAGA